MARSASTTRTRAIALATYARRRRTPPTWSGRTAQWKISPNITARLFVSASNTNNVYVLGVTESGDLSRLETINLALTPRQPLGMTPSGLGLSADGKKLFVACSDANAAAVVDISGAAQPRARLRADGLVSDRCVRAAGRAHGCAERQGLALVSRIPRGPNPLKRPEPVHEGARRQSSTSAACRPAPCSSST